MATFGITPVSGFPLPQSEDFPQFIQFQENGEDLGAPDADTLNFANGVTATRGTGENANVVTVTAEGGGGAGPITWRSAAASTTLVLADAENGVAMNGGASAVVTIPTHAAVAYDTGVSILLLWESGVKPTIDPAVGVTLTIDPSFEASIARLNGVVSLINRAVNSWVLAGDMTTIGGVGEGTVTAVGLDMPAEFSVDPYEITQAGVFTVTKAPQPANRVWAGPAAGGAAVPSFRPLVNADLPVAAAQAANLVQAGPASGGAAVPGYRALVNADLPVLARQFTWRTPAAGNYTPVIGDAENGVVLQGGTLTIPPHSAVAFDDGTSILLKDNKYSDPFLIAGGAGVTVQVRAGLSLFSAGQYALITIVQQGIDNWVVGGDLELAA
jgi:hypothetical protein